MPFYLHGVFDMNSSRQFFWYPSGPDGRKELSGSALRGSHWNQYIVTTVLGSLFPQFLEHAVTTILPHLHRLPECKRAKAIKKLNAVLLPDTAPQNCYWLQQFVEAAYRELFASKNSQRRALLSLSQGIASSLTLDECRFSPLLTNRSIEVLHHSMDAGSPPNTVILGCKAGAMRRILEAKSACRFTPAHLANRLRGGPSDIVHHLLDQPWLFRATLESALQEWSRVSDTPAACVAGQMCDFLLTQVTPFVDDNLDEQHFCDLPLIPLVDGTFGIFGSDTTYSLLPAHACALIESTPASKVVVNLDGLPKPLRSRLMTKSHLLNLSQTTFAAVLAGVLDSKSTVGEPSWFSKPWLLRLWVCQAYTHAQANSLQMFRRTYWMLSNGKLWCPFL